MSDASATTTSAVTTTSGAVSGTVEPDGIRRFLGIPYAAAPVGRRRFRPAEAPDPWTGVHEAREYGPVAVQLDSPLEKLFGGPELITSEADCLTLNVWTPSLDGAKRPVMMWIHGGAFITGSGATPWYDGARFAAHGDVVVVTINYRLGAFGFLHLAGEGGEEFAGSGNAGITDQIRALEWVRDNIAEFGGDPAQVTIFGESAGAMSVGTLLGAPAADGLFHRAILQSGAASTVADREFADGIAHRLLDAAGVASARALAELGEDAILAAQAEVLKSHVGAAGLHFQPVVDGTVLPEAPLTRVQAGRTGQVPTLVGTCRDEMTLFLVLDLGIGEIDGEGMTRLMHSVFGDRSEDAVRVYTENRPGLSPKDVYTAIATDRVFRIPAIRLAETQVANALPTYMYLFSWATPILDGTLKSCHALELPFVFDNLDKAGASFFTGRGPERQGIADAMHAAWIAFARTGDPGWPAYDTEKRMTQRFDTAREVLTDPMGDERALWDGIA